MAPRTEESSPIEQMAAVGRAVLVWAAVLMLAPAGGLLLLAAGFMLFPAALVGLPFMLPVFFGNGAAERQHEREHDALPMLEPAHA